MGELFSGSDIRRTFPLLVGIAIGHASVLYTLSSICQRCLVSTAEALVSGLDRKVLVQSPDALSQSSKHIS